MTVAIESACLPSHTWLSKVRNSTISVVILGVLQCLLFRYKRDTFSLYYKKIKKETCKCTRYIQ